MVDLVQDGGVRAAQPLTGAFAGAGVGSARVLAVANRKGGAGKSSTVVNLAAAWAAVGRRVLVVDLDPQGHAGLGLGRVAGAGAVTVHDCLRSGAANLASGVVATAAPGVDLLPADREFDGDVRVSDPRRLAQALAPLACAYDFVLIDTPPSAPRLIVSALMAAEVALVPTLLDPLSLDGTAQFLRAYHTVVTGLRAGLVAALVVPSRVDLRSTMQRDALAALISRVGAGQVAAGVRVDVAVAEAFGARRPLRLYRPGARAVADFARLADAVAWRFASAEAVALRR